MNYKKHYDLLINRAINRTIDGYTENHHIIPRCMGGIDEKSNLVKLTPEEHYVAHQLLVKIYPEVNGLVFAVLMMSGKNNHKFMIRNNKTFGWIRRKHIQKQKEFYNEFEHPCKGKPLSEAHKEKISKSWESRIVSDETRKKMSESRQGEKHHNYGKKASAELLLKLSISHLGQKAWNKGMKYKRENGSSLKGRTWKINENTGKREWICL